MNYYDKNIECMKQYKSKLYEKLQDNISDFSINKPDQINSLLAKDGDLYLEIEKGNNRFRLNSSYSPRHEAKVWCDQYTFHNMNAIITMYGFGNGSFAREILCRKDEKDILFIYEPCLELFQHVINHYDITDLLKRPEFFLILEGINEIEFSFIRNLVNMTNMSSQIQCVHPLYDDIFPESCVKYWKEIKDNYFHAMTNINTEIIFGQRYIINSIFNIRFIRDSYLWMDLKEDFDLQIPAIIVAAGPSLKKNIEDLKRAKGKAYIFVVDRILDYVLDEGVEPDYIATVDPIKPIEYFTQRTDVQIPLLCIPVANWEVLDRHKGKKIIYCSSPYYYNMYTALEKKPPLLDTGASVATAVFSACIQMGFKRIILVGQDLAYDGDKTHASGAPEKLSVDRQIYVEGIDGNQVKSRHDWYEFLTWFKTTIANHPDIEVFDVKEKGAKIPGTINMSLDEVLNKYCTVNIQKTNVTEDKQGAFRDDEMERVKQFFTDSMDKIDTLKKKSKEAIKICEGQIRDYLRNPEETTTTVKRYKQISKINKYIEEQPVYALLESYITAISAQYISKIYNFTDDAKADKVSTYQKAQKIFESMIQAADFVKPILEEAINHI